MLSSAQVVAVRRGIESMYEGTCTVVERQKVKMLSGATGFEEHTVHENLPCRVSYGTPSATTEGTNVAAVGQAIKLFLAPEVVIVTGSKLIVVQNGRETVYAKSGEASVYPTHQEIGLELFQKWA